MDMDETVIVAGIGSRKGVTASDVLAAIDAALAAHGLRRDELGLLATAELKRGESGLREAAEALGLELRIIEEAAMRPASERMLTWSKASLREAGTASVSEASALAAAGLHARLLGPRIRLRTVTCAIAATGVE